VGNWGDRIVAGSFGTRTNPRRGKPNFWGLTLIAVHLVWQPLKNLPEIIRLRKLYKKRKAESLTSKDLAEKRPLRVAILADTLDEVNGISNNSRQVVQYLRDEMHKDISLIGIVNYPAAEGRREKNGTILIPQVFSTEMVGYPDSDFSIPSIKDILRWLRRWPADLIELETPTPGCYIALIVCKLIGIRVISHYRTDALGYTKLLVKNLFQITWVKYWTMLFCHLTKPVIVPSKDFKEKLVHEIGMKPDEVAIIRRGINTANYSPEFREQKHWEEWFPGERRIRFLFVGRVSREKALPFLTEVWENIQSKHPGKAELLIVGHGPFEQELASITANWDSVKLTGRLSGPPLYSLYAEADFFVFPSGTDTFGNVVVESLASGTPALVSDSGGPCEIVEPEQSGWILPFENHNAWQQKIEQVIQMFQENPEQYQNLRNQAWERGCWYSLEESCKEFWNFYESVSRS